MQQSNEDYLINRTYAHGTDRISLLAKAYYIHPLSSLFNTPRLLFCEVKGTKKSSQIDMGSVDDLLATLAAPLEIMMM